MKVAAVFAALVLLACSGSSKPSPQPPVGNQPDQAVSGDVPARTDPEQAESQVSIGPDADPRAPNGRIVGVIRDGHGELLMGATVVASSAAMQGSQTAITDEHGAYELTELPPGSYIVEAYYSDHHVELPPVTVAAGQRTELRISRWDVESANSEIIIIK